MTAAIVLDLDGVIVDTEQVWDRARRDYVAAHGGRWRDDATRAMQGMSSREWPLFLRDELGADGEPDRISRDIAAKVVEEVHRDLPLLPGAVDAVRELAGAHTLGLASSANREVIDAVLETAGLAPCFGATVSSEEVARGKPAPDVYLEAAARLGVEAARCAAVEDSTNGLLAAKAAGMLVVAVPNREFPPSEEALAVADAVLDGIAAVPAYFMR